MPLIRIEEKEVGETSENSQAFQAFILFDDTAEFPITVSAPFDRAGEAELEWYFEHFLKFPFTENVRFAQAAQSVIEYGESLFQQVFGNDGIAETYRKYLKENPDRWRFEIAGSPEFHSLHWESLKDPNLPRAWALDAPMVRINLKPYHIEIKAKDSPTVNLLIVTARPRGKNDIAFRTISKPLVEVFEQTELPVKIHILRPGTYQALFQHLEEKKPGHYHVIHFDVHGSLMTYDDLDRGGFLDNSRYGRNKFTEYEGLRAYLSLETEKESRSDLVEAGEIADLLTRYQIPVAILNACQSAKQSGKSDTSLGSRLMSAGVRTVLAM
ncbi:MAG: hypothetical protein BWK80_54150, partial [Desulfobacteraceae bacterium IS3]